MNKTISAFLLAVAPTFAAVPVSFTSGSPAKADDVNKNFASLDSAIQKKADANAVTVLQAALTSKADQGAITSLQSAVSGLQASKIDSADFRRVRDTVRTKVDSIWVAKKITSSQPAGTLLASNNLKDLADTAAARKNLGLGAMAKKDSLTAKDVGALPSSGGSLTGAISGQAGTFSGQLTSNQDNTAVAVAGGVAGMGSYYGGATTAWFGRHADFKTYRGYLSNASGMTINEPSWNSHFLLNVGGVSAIDAVSSGGTVASTSITLNASVGVIGLLSVGSNLSASGNVQITGKTTTTGDAVFGSGNDNTDGPRLSVTDGNYGLTGSAGSLHLFSETGAIFIRKKVNGEFVQAGQLASENWTSSRFLASSGGALQGNLHVVGNLTTSPTIPVADYVFEPDYKLTSLSEVEAYTKEHKHLPEVPSAAEIGKSGLDLAQMNLVLLKKVEELTLHAIAQQKEIADLKTSVQELKSR